MKYGSVCSGIEAATVAWLPLGWEPAFFSEIEAFPSAVLKHHYPKVENRGDMTRFKEWPDERIDVLVGGTPCQSFSVAGLRKGLADPRGNLALVFLALADRLRPRWVVWENVPGVLSSAEGRDFGSFVGGLGELGYGWAYRILDAQYFGVPQRRRRVFVVGHLGDWRRAAAVLFERSCLQGNPAPSREAGKAVAHTLKGGSGVRGWDNSAEAADSLTVECSPTLRGRANSSHRADSMAYIATPPLSHCLNAKGGSLRMDAESETLIPSGGGFEVTHSLRADGFDASEDGTGPGTPIIPILEVGKGTSSRGDGPNGCGIGKDGDPMYTLQAGAQHAIGFGAQNSARQGDDVRVEQAPTLDKSKIPGVQSNMAVRRLTPRECERLQGFPDDYTLVPYRKKPAADGPRYKALGNSMARPVMEWIGRRIDLVG